MKQNIIWREKEKRKEMKKCHRHHRRQSRRAKTYRIKEEKNSPALHQLSYYKIASSYSQF